METTKNNKALCFVLIMAALAIGCMIWPKLQTVKIVAVDQRAELLKEDLIYLSDSHAIERHGEIAITIKNKCMKNPLFVKSRSLDGRFALGCEYEPGKFGITIMENWPPKSQSDYVTSFKNKGKTIDKVLEYLSNRGFKQ